VAISFVGSAVPGGNPTTSFTITIPTVSVGDLLILATTNRDADAAPTVTDNDTGGNTWTEKSSVAGCGRLFYKFATSGTSAKTITASGFTGSCSGVLVVLRGTKASGDPFNQYSHEANASANETHAAITPTVNGCWVGLAVHNDANDNAVTASACTSPGSLTEGNEKLSTGGSDCGCSLKGLVQATAGSTGAFTWAQTDGATVSQAFAVEPLAAVDGTANGSTITVTASMQAGVATSSAWTPSELGSANTAQWDIFDASKVTVSGGTVSQVDNSGALSTLALTQATGSKQPTYTGGGVVFDGSTDTLGTSSVNYTSLFSGGNGLFYAVVAYTSGTKLFSWDVSTNSRMGLEGDSRFDWGDAATDGIMIFSGATLSTSYKILTVVKTATTSAAYINGTQVDSQSNTTTPSGSTAIWLGTHDGVNLPAACSFRAIGFIDDASTDTRERVEGRLAHYLGLTDGLGSGHTYKTTPPLAGTNGTATGATITATASMEAGTATGDAAASGATITATASLIAGAASIDGTAAGSTIAATASLEAGTATGDASAAASTPTATASLVAGTATGDATAAGDTITATASLVAGTAEGSGNATAAGSTITVTASMQAGSAEGGSAPASRREYIVGPPYLNETGARQYVTANYYIIETVTAAGVDDTAPGATITATASLVAGTATGDATAAGATIVATASLVAGTATAAAAASSREYIVGPPYLNETGDRQYIVDGYYITETATVVPDVPVATVKRGGSYAPQGDVRRSKRLKDPRSTLERLRDRFRAVLAPVDDGSTPAPAAAKAAVTAARRAPDGDILAPSAPALAVAWDQVVAEMARQDADMQALAAQAVEILEAILEDEDEEDVMMLLMAA
jgi:hypothetical protein